MTCARACARREEADERHPRPDTDLENKSVLQTLKESARDPTRTIVFNYASEALNNSFFLSTLVSTPEKREKASRTTLTCSPPLAGAVPHRLLLRPDSILVLLDKVVPNPFARFLPRPRLSLFRPRLGLAPVFGTDPVQGPTRN